MITTARVSCETQHFELRNIERKWRSAAAAKVRLIHHLGAASATRRGRRAFHRQRGYRLRFACKRLAIAFGHAHVALHFVVECREHSGVVCLFQRDRERGGVVENVKRTVPLCGALTAALCIERLVAEHFVTKRLNSVDEARPHAADIARDGQG